MTATTFQFGVCTLDLAARVLTREEQRIELSPLVFDCIAWLILHRARAVGRDELVAAVWGRTEVSDTVLRKTLFKARQALGDVDNAQQVIRTLPRFGYQWVAEVSELVAEPDRPPLTVEAAPAPPSARRRSLQVAAWTLLACVLLLAPWAAWRALTPSLVPAIEPVTQAVAPAQGAIVTNAVLPVRVHAAEEWSWLRLGLMDLIATRLRNGGLPVLASATVVSLVPEASVPADAVQRVRAATDADYVLVPRVQWAANEWVVHIDVQRADAAAGQEVEARAGDVIVAAQVATDRLLDVLGLERTSDSDVALDLAGLLQRTEAAVLVHDFSRASRLLQEADADLLALPEVRLRQALVDYRAGRLDAAQARLQPLTHELSEEDEPVLLARALTGLGAVALARPVGDAVIAQFDPAVRLLEHRNEPVALGYALMGRGVNRSMTGRYEQAGDDFARARIALQLAGDTLAVARIDLNEGAMLMARGRYAESMPLLERARARFERLGAKGELATTLGNLGEVQLILLQPAEALALSEQLLPLLAGLENLFESRRALSQRARALAATGHIGEARNLFQSLASSADPQRESVLLAKLRLQLALLDSAAGDPASAADGARQAVADLDTRGNARPRGIAWHTLIRALQDSGDVAAAQQERLQFSAWARGAGNASAALYAHLAEAEQEWSGQPSSTAMQAYRDLVRQAEQQAAPADVAAVVASFATALMNRGELEQASAMVGIAARWADRDFACALLQTRFYHALGSNDAWHAALLRARSLAGERSIPAHLSQPPRVPTIDLIHPG